MTFQSWFREHTRHAPATLWIIALCSVVWLVTAVQAQALNDSVWGSSLGSAMVLWGPAAQVESWGMARAVTSIFLHLGVGHLIVNMVMLLLIGPEIERFVGSGPYALAFVAGGLGGSAAISMFNFNTPTAGASGAIYALMPVMVAIAYRRSVDLRAPIVFLAIAVGYTFLAGNVSVWGHLGGVLAGAVMAWPLTSAQVRTRWLSAGLVALISGVLIILALT